MNSIEGKRGRGGHMRLFRKLLSLFSSPRVNSAQLRASTISNSNMSPREKFEAIYREQIWAKASPTLFSSQSLSGHGSTELYTRGLRAALPEFLRVNAVRSMFDAPCGDYHWMRLVDLPKGFKYIGGDIVTPVVENNARKFANDDRVFLSFDLTCDKFPVADAWLCKDCLQHLSFRDVHKALKNFAKSRINWGLITNHTDVIHNCDIETGDFRHLDLTRPPFNLPPARFVLPSGPEGSKHAIFVWKREDIVASLDRGMDVS